MPNSKRSIPFLVPAILVVGERLSNKKLREEDEKRLVQEERKLVAEEKRWLHRIFRLKCRSEIRAKRRKGGNRK